MIQNTRKFGLKFKLSLLSCNIIFAVSLIYIVIDINNMKSQQEMLLQNQKERMMQDYDEKIQWQVENIVSLIASYDKLYEKQGLSKEERMQMVKEIIRDIRYGTDGYFWIDTFEVKNVLLPPSPETEGSDRSGVKDSDGVLFVKELVEIAKKNDKGFFNWRFRKMGDETEYPKRGYISAYRDYQWAIGTGVYLDEIDRNIARQKDILNAELRSNITKSIITSIFMMLLSCFIFLALITRMFIKPITFMSSKLKDIAHGEGDLTVQLPILGNDEITDMSQYFNETIGKIRDSIKEVGTNAQTMENIGEELSSNMAQTSSALNQISANIDGVNQQALNQASSVTKTAGTIEQIIHTIENLNLSIESQASSIVQSSAAIEQMVANIDSINKSIENSDNMIKNLVGSTSTGKQTLLESSAMTQKIVEQSGSLIDASNIIRRIANQTNLLAMNAAIEAAHAGESGKGFAVVADEIRKLAEESAVQGKTITETLKDLSNKILSLASGTKSVEDKFNIISDMAEKVLSMSSHLTSAMEEQENGSHEVLTAIKNISHVTQEIKDGSAEMLEGGKGISSEMTKLDELTTLIKESMGEMSVGVQQMAKAVVEINDLAIDNRNSIENLATEVKKFKT